MRLTASHQGYSFDYTVLGWKKDEDQDARVFLGFDCYPLSASSICSPENARRLAAALLSAADEAEGLPV